MSSSTIDKVRTRPATLAEVRQKLREASALLEEARRMMVYPDCHEVDADDVHALAMAQYEVGQLIEGFSPEARSRAAVRKVRKR